MTRIVRFATLLFTISGLSSVANAQKPQPPAPKPKAEPGASSQAVVRTADSSKTLLLTLKDGSVVVGHVRTVESDSVVFVSTVGVLRLAVGDVRRAEVVRPQDLHSGEYWFPNPNSTRLLFAPTGRMLNAGKGYFSDYMVFFPGVAVGMTDHVTIGGGMSIFPGNFELDNQLFYFTPKVAVYRSEQVNMAVGALAIRAGFGDETAGLLYGVGTFGGEDASFTVGAGYGFQGSNLADSPTIMIGGDKRVSQRFGLVTENYIIPGFEGEILGSLGMRFFGEKMSFDLGAFTVVGDQDAFFFPFVGFVVNF